MPVSKAQMSHVHMVGYSTIFSLTGFEDIAPLCCKKNHRFGCFATPVTCLCTLFTLFYCAFASIQRRSMQYRQHRFSRLVLSFTTPDTPTTGSAVHQPLRRLRLRMLVRRPTSGAVSCLQSPRLRATLDARQPVRLVRTRRRRRPF